RGFGLDRSVRPLRHGRKRLGVDRERVLPLRPSWLRRSAARHPRRELVDDRLPLRAAHGSIRERALDEKHEPRLPLRAKPGHGNDTPVLEQTMSNPDTPERRRGVLAPARGPRSASGMGPSQVPAVSALPEDASDAIAREAVGLTQT